MLREIYKGTTIHVFSEDVELPNGKTIALDLVRHPGASAVVPLKTNGHVILVHQYRHATGGYLYEIPAGKLSKDENPEDCAIRETEEEIGYRVEKLQKLTSIFTAPGFCDEIIHLYLGTELTVTAQKLDEDEIIEIIELPFEEAMTKITNQTIRDAKSIIGLQLAYGEAKNQGLI